MTAHSSRQSPLMSVHAHCVWCCSGHAGEVARCPAQHCPLWLLRLGHRPKALDVERQANVALHPCERPATASELHETSGAVLKAIRRRCIDCSGGPNHKVSAERAAELLRRLQR